MNDKQFVIDVVRHMPENTTLGEIAREIDFLAAVREAETEADRGEVVPHATVKEESASWLAK